MFSLGATLLQESSLRLAEEEGLQLQPGFLLELCDQVSTGVEGVTGPKGWSSPLHPLYTCWVWGGRRLVTCCNFAQGLTEENEEVQEICSVVLRSQSNFKRVLLNQCQTSFEQCPVHRPAGGSWFALLLCGT